MFFSPTNPSMAWVFFRLIHRGAVRRIAFPPDLALFSKALITTEAMGLGLYPDFDFNAHLAPFVKETFRAYFDPSRLSRFFMNDFIDYIDFFMEMPRQLKNVVRKLENREGFGVRLDARDTAFIEKALRRQADRRTAEVSLLGTAFFLAAMVLTGVWNPALARTLLACATAFFAAIFFVFLIKAGGKG
jgi:ubiquinone biosynthesis protein